MSERRFVWQQNSVETGFPAAYMPAFCAAVMQTFQGVGWQCECQSSWLTVFWEINNADGSKIFYDEKTVPEDLVKVCEEARDRGLAAMAKHGHEMRIGAA